MESREKRKGSWDRRGRFSVNLRAKERQTSTFFVPKGVIGQLSMIFWPVGIGVECREKVRWNGEKSEGLNSKGN